MPLALPLPTVLYDSNSLTTPQLTCAVKLVTAATYTTLGLARAHQPIKYQVEAPGDLKLLRGSTNGAVVRNWLEKLSNIVC